MQTVKTVAIFPGGHIPAYSPCHGWICCSHAQRNKTTKASYILVSARLRMSDVRVYDSRGTNSQGLEGSPEDSRTRRASFTNVCMESFLFCAERWFPRNVYEKCVPAYFVLISKSDSFGNNSLVRSLLRSAYCPAPVFQSKETCFSPGEAVKAEVAMCL